MTELTKISTFKEAIEVLSLFDTGNIFYWLTRLEVSEAVKGRLVVYFNL